ncbi:ketopantoate reductase [Bacteroidia bacterium]|nr:ketopantoate reductase [Bacteroidia bacterium]
MKILIYGAGIIGSTYGWQLSKVSCDITVLVRPEKLQSAIENGINIQCSDFRGGQKQTEQVIFRPKIVDKLLPENDFEYIIVPTNCIYLKEILPELKESAGKAHILFFQNMWDDFDEISNYLSPKQYLFGFPFMVGGGRNEHSINSAISGLKYSHTPLGELTGEITPRLQKITKAMEDANLKPVISDHIKIWLITHYAVAAGLSAGIMKAGSGKAFVQNPGIIKEAIKAIREGLSVCTKRGINIKMEKSNKLYSLPLFLAVPIAKKIYSNEAIQLMFDGHTKHAPEEMKKMFADMIEYGEKYNVKSPCLRSLQTSIFESTK